MHDTAKKLRKYRERHEMSYRAMADRCGISAATLCRIEKGESVSIESAKKLAGVFGCNWKNLL